MLTADQFKEAARKAAAAGDVATARNLIARAKAAEQAAPPKSLWQSLKENVVGDNDPSTMNAGEKLGTLFNMGGESMTFGLVGDEAAAAADAMIGRGGYNDQLAKYRGDEKQVWDEDPGLALAANVLPAFIPGAGLAGLVAKAPGVAGKVAASGGLGALTGGIYGGMEADGGDRMAGARDGAMIGGGVGLATPALGALARKAWEALGARGARAGMAATTQSSDELKGLARGLYDDAERLGVTASQPQTQALAAQTRALAAREGAVSPTGRIASSLPAVKDAIRMADDYAKGTMNPAQMQSVRTSFQGAAGSAVPNERRIGREMLEQFDNFVEPLAPQFKEANALYARAKRGDMIQEAIDLAGSRAGQFSGSGFENALRTEFRALERKIIKGQIKGLTPDQVNAISRVARGGAVENILRGIGKAAPTGVVSAGMAGGMPFLIGNALGGPVVGAAAGLGTLAAGTTGRAAATGMQRGNAAFANAIMRSADGMTPKAQNGGVIEELLRRALLGNAGQASTLGSLLQQSIGPQ